MKICYRCKENKDVSEYHKNKFNKSGLGSYCRNCKKLIRREERKRNGLSPKQKIYNKTFLEKNENYHKDYSKKYYQENKEKKRQYYLKRKEELKSNESI